MEFEPGILGDMPYEDLVSFLRASAAWAVTSLTDPAISGMAQRYGMKAITAALEEIATRYDSDHADIHRSEAERLLSHIHIYGIHGHGRLDVLPAVRLIRAVYEATSSQMRSQVVPLASAVRGLPLRVKEIFDVQPERPAAAPARTPVVQDNANMFPEAGVAVFGKRRTPPVAKKYVARLPVFDEATGTYGPPRTLTL